MTLGLDLSFQGLRLGRALAKPLAPRLSQSRPTTLNQESSILKDFAPIQVNLAFLT